MISTPGDKKISQLDLALPLKGDEVLAGVQDHETVKISSDQLATYVLERSTQNATAGVVDLQYEVTERGATLGLANVLHPRWAPYDLYLTEVRVWLDQPSLSGDVQLQLLADGREVLATPAVIPAGQTTLTQALALAIPDIARDTKFTWQLLAPGAGAHTLVAALSYVPAALQPERRMFKVAQAVSAGQLVNLYWDASAAALLVRPANAALGHRAHGFVRRAAALNEMVAVHLHGINDLVTDLTPGDAWLALTPGQASSAPPPVVAGHIAQNVGMVLSATALDFDAGPVLIY